ncbi:neurexin-4-like [Liolophura sinensis]|uniref:neurexin-4-like n=1 Tax=Liolophura sinensis TaxID=3198878 RepID=UPI003158CD06
MDYMKPALLTVIICTVLGITPAKESFTFYFDGSDYLTYAVPNSSPDPVSFNLSFRVWPEINEGVLFYSYRAPGDAVTLEIHDDSIYKRTNYGSPTSGTVRTLSSGSGVGLHEDEEWRDISMSINDNGSMYDVNKLKTFSPNPTAMPLGDVVYIGGYADKTIGIESKTYFKGCIEDFVFNGVNVFEEIRNSDQKSDVSSKFPSECPLIVSYLSFYGMDSYLKIRSEDVPEAKLRSISFEFRTFDFNASLVLMDLGATNVSVEFKENSTIVFRTFSFGFGFDNTYPLGFDLGDGEYHKLEVRISNDGLSVIVDDFQKSDADMKAPRGSDIQAYVLAGFPGRTGYKGCMRELRVNRNRVKVSGLPEENLENITTGRCDLIDRCYMPRKRCAHGGKCIRYREDFSCDCQGTGYKGPSCVTPMYPSSCSDVDIPDHAGRITAHIDVDGAGPLRPAKVLCTKDKGTGVIKTLLTSNAAMAAIPVDGFQKPGSYQYNITYGPETDLDVAVGVIDRAKTCRQYVKYTCNQARLMASPEGSSVPFGWWVGREGTPHYYWGEADPGSRTCSCGAVDGGCLGGLPCNCDAQEAYEVSDDGYLTNKTHLPVTQVRFGDTGTSQDTKFASYLVGDVECSGDAVLEKTVTIQKLGAFINVSRYLSSAPLDISFEFKTTIQKAQLMYAVGSGDYLSIVMEDEFRISVKMKFTGGVINHTEKVQRRLNDDEWHRVYLEMTHMHVLLSVDGRSTTLWQSKKWRFHMYLSTGRPFMIGGNSNGTFGFVGCFRGLVVKGKHIDLVNIVEQDKPFGVVTGCVGQCGHMSLCQNAGTCKEYYATYMCDCAESAFNGCYCGNAIGVRFNVGSWMKLEVQRIRQSPFEFLQLHFKSTKRQGVLAYMSNPQGKAILTIELNLRGGVDISYDSGNSQWGLFTSVDGLADGTPHRVTVRVTGSARGRRSTWDVEFDDDVQTAESAESEYIPDKLYLASKSASSAFAGFDGCIFGLRYNGLPLLKYAKTYPPSLVSYSKNVNLNNEDCGETENTQPMPSSDPEAPTADNSRRPVMINSFKSESLDEKPSAIVVSHFMNLVCRSLGYPEPRYVIRQNGEHMMCPHLVVDRNTLLLPPDPRVDGDYQCVAINDWGKSLSDHISVGTPKLLEVSSVIEESLFIREGQYLRLRCNVSVDSVPEASTEWSEGVDLENNMATRFYQGVDGDLHFVWVLPVDSRVFTCNKANHLIGRVETVKRIQVQVNPVSDPTEYTSKPSELVYSSPSPMFADLGDSVTLECLVTGDPAPTVSWLFDGNTTENTTFISQLRGRRLFLPKFTTKEEGEYQCLVDGVTMASIMLNKTLRPTWLNGPKPTSVYQDQDAELPCVTNPLPEDAAVNTEWFINGEPLELKPTYSLNENGDVLTINKASKLNDIITYQCNVSNQYGFVYGEGYLNVHLGTTIVGITN